MDVDELKRLMAKYGENQAGLARLVGITPDKMSKTIKGTRSLKLEEANTLRAYFGQLEGGESERQHQLPIVGIVSAGAWREGFETIMGYMPSPDSSLSKDAFVVVIEGDSMDRIASEGESIVIEPRDRQLIDGKFYLIRNGDGEMTFKQYRESPARLEPCSTNSAHQTIYPGQEVFEVIGRARNKVTSL